MKLEASMRRLYVAAYDICAPRRLRAALHVLKGYATGGQKSVFECFLTPAERAALLAEIGQVIEASEDSFSWFGWMRDGRCTLSASPSLRRILLSFTTGELCRLSM
jgi:CRISPR/Cas system-associated endoribonuclease Cas2